MQRNEILRSYGTDYKNMTKELLEAAAAAEAIRMKCRAAASGSDDNGLTHELSGTDDDNVCSDRTVRTSPKAPSADAAVSSGSRAGNSRTEARYRLHIGIKPNLVCPTPADFGGTTHPEIVAGIIEYLLEHGFHSDEIEILEGSWVGDKTEESFEYCGYNALSRKYGVRLTDTQKERDIASLDCAGLKLNICRHALELDYLINVPVLKGHCQTKVTCALKNMKGLIPNSEKRRFHSLGLHKPIAHLNTVLKPDLIVIDHICGDLDFEEGGNPLIKNCIMVAQDPVLTDAYTAKVLGYDVADVDYITIAERLGVGSADLGAVCIRTVRGVLAEGEPQDSGNGENSVDGESYDSGVGVPLTRRLVDIAYVVDEIDSCSACYGRLMPALDRLRDEGLLEQLIEYMQGNKLGIGQGYRGRSGMYGIGSCTANFAHCVKGCPPQTDDIYRALRELIQDYKD